MKNISKTVLFVCGGTGGHVFPAVAIADALLNVGGADKIIFAGRAYPSMEYKLLSDNWDYKTISAIPLKRSGILKNVFLPLLLFLAILKAIKLLLSVKPQFVVATGGFVALPVMLAAFIMHVPVYAEEPNAVMGVANRICSKFAKKVYSANEKFGNPIRNLPDSLPLPNLFSEDKFKILITGGSQGASGINKKVEESIERISKNENLSVVWQVGSRNFEIINKKYSDLKNISVVPFLNDIYAYMQHSDLIISRSGASTLAEILAFGKPSILFPYPYATGNHQEFNARQVEKKGASFVELDFEPNDLWNKVENLFQDREKLSLMAKKANELGELNRRAAKEIALDIKSRQESGNV